jgi:hypothetical protein
MSWSQNSKRQRFENSQIKKSKAAGLRRLPSDNEEVFSCSFNGTFEAFIEHELFANASFSESMQNTINVLSECKKEAIDMIHSGALKLKNGEELRNYVPKQFKSGVL